MEGLLLLRNVRFTFLTIVCCLSFLGKADITWVQVGVDGLTCSQCSRSVEMSIRKLGFVQDVQMNLEHTEGKITFKPGAKIDLKKIANAVLDAGFSVRYLSVGFNFDNVNTSTCVPFGENQFQFIKTEAKVLNGEAVLKVIGRKFMPKKEFKKWKEDLTPACDKAKGEIFYVTL